MGEKSFGPELPRANTPVQGEASRAESKPNAEQKTVLENIREARGIKTLVKTLSIAAMLSGKSDDPRPNFVNDKVYAESVIRTEPDSTDADRKNEIEQCIRAENGGGWDALLYADELRKMPGGDATIERALEHLFREVEIKGRNLENVLDVIRLQGMYAKEVVRSPSFDRYYEILRNIELRGEKRMFDGLPYSNGSLLAGLESLAPGSRAEMLQKLTLEVVQSNGGSYDIICHASALKDTEIGRTALEKAAHTIITKPEILSGGLLPSTEAVKAFIGEPYGEKLLEILASKSEEMWIRSIHDLRAVPWGIDFIRDRSEKLFKTNPALFLEYIDELREFRPDLTGGTGVQICVKKMAANDDTEDLFENIRLFAYEPYAEGVVRKAAEANPGSAVIKLFQYLRENKKEPSWGGDVRERSVHLLAERDPKGFMGTMSVIDDVAKEPYIGEIMHGLAKTNPNDVLLGSGFWNAVGDRYADVLREAMENAVDSHSETVLSVLDYKSVSKLIPEWQRKSLFDRAIRNAPEAVFRQYGGDRESPCQKLLSESSDHTAGILREIKEKYSSIKVGRLGYDEQVPEKIERVCALIDSILKGKFTVSDAALISEDDDRFLQELIAISIRKGHAGKESVDEQLMGMTLRKVVGINRLHEARDDVRFASLERSSAEELYLLSVYGEQEIYTSSFNGVFNRMLERMRERNMTGDVLFRRVSDTRFRTFFKMCVNYNRLDDFLATMSETEQQSLALRFVRGLDKERDKMLEQAVTVAEAINATKNPKLTMMMRDGIRQEYERTNHEGKADSKKIYGLLSGLFGRHASIDDAWYAEMAKRYSLPELNQIDKKDLVDSHGVNVQRYYFYDDTDGKASFEHFLGSYRGERVWNIEDHGSYVIVRNRTGSVPIEMYANKPDGGSGEQDLDELFKKEAKIARVFVHRGHSYHANDSVHKLTDGSKLVILGSCGGYGNLNPILEKSPGAHIISTKGTGTMLVNDRYLRKLNAYISSGKSIEWKTFWVELEKEMGNTPGFKDYVPPHKNFGVIFLKAYRSGSQVRTSGTGGFEGEVY